MTCYKTGSEDCHCFDGFSDTYQGPNLNSLVFHPIIIKNRHEIYCFIARECYSPNRVKYIGDVWVLDNLESTDRFCFYISDAGFIMGCRGTVGEKSDIVENDLIGISAIGGDNFQRAIQGTQVLAKYKEKYPFRKCLGVTGHSLGGGAARVVGKNHGVMAVCFNGAAPPTNPVVGRNSDYYYHIVFDIVSAWSSGNVIRIDNGLRPNKLGLTQTISCGLRGVSLIAATTCLYEQFKPAIDGHYMSNFFSNKGSVIDANSEQLIWEGWFNNLDSRSQSLFKLAASGKGFPATVNEGPGGPVLAYKEKDSLEKHNENPNF